MTLTLVESSATFSPCGGYRYDLVRRWGEGPSVCWVMLNPSTATETTNDPTIRRCIDFSKRWGAGALVVVNLYALRSTDPRGLVGGLEPNTPDNAHAIRRHIAATAVTVAAWGATCATLGLARYNVECWVADAGRELWCLGRTKEGHPRHPLYVPRAKAPELFGSPWQEGAPPVGFAGLSAPEAPPSAGRIFSGATSPAHVPSPEGKK